MPQITVAGASTGSSRADSTRQSASRRWSGSASTASSSLASTRGSRDHRHDQLALADDAARPTRPRPDLDPGREDRAATAAPDDRQRSPSSTRARPRPPLAPAEPPSITARGPTSAPASIDPVGDSAGEPERCLGAHLAPARHRPSGAARLPTRSRRAPRGCPSSPAGSARACRCRASSRRGAGRRGPCRPGWGKTSRSIETLAVGRDQVEDRALEDVGAGVDLAARGGRGRVGLLGELGDPAVGVPAHEAVAGRVDDRVQADRRREPLRS